MDNSYFCSCYDWISKSKYYSEFSALKWVDSTVYTFRESISMISHIVRGRRDIVEFDDIYDFKMFCNDIKAKHLFIFSEKLNLSKYMINVDDISGDVETHKSFGIQWDKLDDDEMFTFIDILSKFNVVLENEFSKCNSCVQMFVVHDGVAYGIVLKSDLDSFDTKCRELFGMLSDYIMKKYYTLDCSYSELFDKASNDINDLRHFLVADSTFRKCVNKYQRGKYKDSLLCFDDDRFASLYYVINNVDLLLRVDSKSVYSIMARYNNVFEDARKLIRAGLEA